MPTVKSGRNLKRIEVCFLLSILHFSLMLLPMLQMAPYLVFLVVLLLADLAICWWALTDVESGKDSEESPNLVNFVKNGIVGITIAGVVLASVLRLLGKSDNQDSLVFLGGFAFLGVAYKILDISIEKWMKELSEQE